MQDAEDTADVERAACNKLAEPLNEADSPLVAATSSCLLDMDINADCPCLPTKCLSKVTLDITAEAAFDDVLTAEMLVNVGSIDVADSVSFASYAEEAHPENTQRRRACMKKTSSIRTS